MKRKIGKLCVITDTAVQKKYSHVEIAQLAIKGGTEMIQFRDKTMSTVELIETARKLKKICYESGVLLIINDRTDVAMIADADGVHLGLDDIPVRDARKLLGDNKIIGGTAHSLVEAREAEKSGADYLGFGHIYPTGSKIKSTPPVGIVALREIVRYIDIPVFAIGGIGLDNINQVMETGVYGAAVIGSIVKSSNPAQSTKQLTEIIYGKKY